MEVIGTVLLILLLIFVLSVGGLLVSVFTPPKDDRLEQARRRAALDEARERGAARDADDQLRQLHRWAGSRARESARRDRGEDRG